MASTVLVEIDGKEYDLHSPVPGEHTLPAALTALAVAVQSSCIAATMSK
jgi:UDP-N-acetylmuramyl pentapeptide synthase